MMTNRKSRRKNWVKNARRVKIRHWYNIDNISNIGSIENVGNIGNINIVAILTISAILSILVILVQQGEIYFKFEDSV